ncbi:MAG: hypothetical protein HYY24_10935 [Verrucomicrobia bacterium]|nr:hypothetical protein [Verrucomicrobiota bacterium]
MRAERKQVVEVLLCSTQRGGTVAGLHEVVLDTEDGLDWKTFCRCDLIYSVPRDDLRDRRGLATLERRRDIVRKIIWSHGWSGLRSPAIAGRGTGGRRADWAGALNGLNR